MNKQDAIMLINSLRPQKHGFFLKEQIDKLIEDIVSIVNQIGDE